MSRRVFSTTATMSHWPRLLNPISQRHGHVLHARHRTNALTRRIQVRGHVNCTSCEIPIDSCRNRVAAKIISMDLQWLAQQLLMRLRWHEHLDNFPAHKQTSVWKPVQDNGPSKCSAIRPHSKSCGWELLWVLLSLRTIPSRFLPQCDLDRWPYLFPNFLIPVLLCVRVWQENNAWSWVAPPRIDLQQVLATHILLFMFVQRNLLSVSILWPMCHLACGMAVRLKHALFYEVIHDWDSTIVCHSFLDC